MIVESLNHFDKEKAFRVFVRTRPLLEREIQNGEHKVLDIISSEKQVLIEDGDKGKFTYDDVFEENASQEEVYHKVVAPLLPLLKSGSNVTIIAYGQTGSGKTYTMGTDPSYYQNDEGILQRAIKTLFEDSILKRSSTPTKDDPFLDRKLKMTFLEKYNETIYDLFSSRVIVQTKTDGVGGLIPIGCREKIASSSKEALSLLQEGNNLRKVSSTDMNLLSSRSHALISIKVAFENENTNVESGTLRLVDLAGAEGVGRNHMEGKGFNEGVSINKDLLAIGKVLAALSSTSAVKPHVPFRESLLTRLLKDALSGNSFTSMVACVNPCSSNVNVTINTLRFAEQARNIKTRPIGISTIKRRGIKRSSEDVSATPGAWKKYVFGRDTLGHNSTISTPGHKPNVSKIPKLNNTFMTPQAINQISPSIKPWTFSAAPSDLPLYPPLPQPIFEEESPTHSIIEPPVNNTTIQISPFVEKVNARLEQSMMKHEERVALFLKGMEDRITQKCMSLINGCETGRRKSLRLLKRDTEEGYFNSKNLKAEDKNGSTEEFLKPKMLRKAIHSIMSQENFTLKNASIQTGNQHSAKLPLLEISNIVGLSNDGSIEPGSFDNGHNTSSYISSRCIRKNCNDIPITSTAFCGKRAVRKSSRLSANCDIRAPFPPKNNNIDNYNLSPLQYTMNNTTNDVSLSSSIDNTVIFNEASPVLKSRLSLKIHSDKAVIEDENKTISNETVLLCSPTGKVNNYKAEKICLKIDNIHNSSISSKMASSLSNDILGQPLFLDETIDCRVAPSNIRRSTRKSALLAQQKNHDLYQSNRRMSRSLLLSKSVVNQPASTSNKSPTKSTGKWELVVSPTFIRNRQKEILDTLNKGNLRELQKLPTVGPKTAMVIHNFRLAYGKFKKVDDLKEIPGLPKSYYSRFMKANLVSHIEFK